jgi:hypothetical protein
VPVESRTSNPETADEAHASIETLSRLDAARLMEAGARMERLARDDPNRRITDREALQFVCRGIRRTRRLEHHPEGACTSGPPTVRHRESLLVNELDGQAFETISDLITHAVSAIWDARPHAEQFIEDAIRGSK